MMRWTFALLLLLGIVNVTSTTARLSYTPEEPFAVQTGRQWLETGTLPAGAAQPPLAMIAAALPWFVMDKISHNNTLAYMSPPDAYVTTLWMTRLGTLPFYVLSCFIVFTWARELFGHRAAMWSLFSYVLLSTPVAYGGLATTDMAYAALFMWALKTGINWLRHPTNHTSLILGVSLGLMISSNVAGILYWPLVMLLIMATQMAANWRYATFLLPIAERHLVRGFLYVFLVGLFVVGVFYRFDYTPLMDTLATARKLESEQPGEWYFYPMIFFLKTPLPFTIAAMIGIYVIVDHARRPAVQRLFPLMAAYGVLLIGMASGTHLGVRHMLPLYPLLAIPAGFGFYLLEKGGRWKQALALGLIGWQLVGFALTHPYHLGYFNEVAGKHPERISPGSDFDWGQDIIALDEALQERNISTIYLCLPRLASTEANLHFLLQAEILPCPREVASGWVAVSRMQRLFHHEHFTWLDGIQPVERIGTSLDLYYNP